jgi:hypothetical protein
VLADVPEMAALLGELLGVEVRSKDNDDYGETVSSLNEQMEACNSVYGRAYDLEKEVESLRKDAELNKRRLRTVCLTIGEICEALGIDNHSEPDMIVEAVRELKVEVDELRKDKDRLDALECNGWDIRNSSSPMADTGDYNQAIEIVGRWMDKPHERVIGEDYNENLRAAIDQAMSADAYPPARPEYDF